MKYTTRCHVVAALLMGIVVGPVTLLLADRDVPFEISKPGFITPANPAPGSEVEINWVDGYRRRDCPGWVERKIIDAWGNPHTIAGADAQYTRTYNPQPVVRTFRLPLNLPTGETTYIATSYFVCNMVHQIWPIKVERPHVKFHVIRPGIQGEQGPPGIQGFQGVQGIQGERGQRGPPPPD